MMTLPPSSVRILELIPLKDDPPIFIKKVKADIPARTSKIYSSVLKVPRISEAPIIDGVLSDEIWKQATLATGFLHRESLAEAQTRIYACHDDKYLYFAAICDEPFTTAIKKQVLEHDGSVWKDDCLEFFFHRKKSEQYLHYIINAIGVTHDRMDRINGSGGDASFNLDGAKAAAVINKSDWVVEIALPIIATGLQKGETVEFNIARERKASAGKKEENSSLIPSFGCFSPPRFGGLELKEHNP
jgi:hypothetical protein